MYTVYILRSITRGVLYVGCCQNLAKRIAQHNAGCSRATAPYRPYELVHTEQYETLAEARKREWHLKHTPGGGKEKKSLAVRRL